ncbi:S8 family peptidase [Actinoplanes sp. NPDC049599]|uniref:S8 family peptidase n=1 Tax=Actinoplanes sp. NPDC049599 TaxID=3363903 RepID=UPI0037AD8EA7
MGQPTAAESSDRDLAIDKMRLSPLLSSRFARTPVRIGVVDGIVDAQHPDLTTSAIRTIGPLGEVPRGMGSSHATFVAGVICANAGSRVPGICPNAHILNYPVAARRAGSPDELDADSMLTAIESCVSLGAMIVNLSIELVRPGPRIERRFADVMNYAAAQGVLVVRATGNDATTSGGLARQHAWPIRVIAYLADGRPTNRTHVGSTLGCQGVGAPGWPTLGLDLAGGYQMLRGTSVATAYVSAALALLWSAYPDRSAASIRRAVSIQSRQAPRAVPALLDMSAVQKELEGQ